MYLPMLLLVKYPEGVPHWGRAAALGLALLVIVAVAVRIALAFGTASERAIAVAMVSILFLTQGALFYVWFEELIALPALIFFYGFSVLVLFRFKTAAVASGVSYGIAVMFSAGLVIALLGAVRDWNPQESHAGGAVPTNVSLNRKPDIYLIVLDGFIGQIEAESVLGEPATWPAAMNAAGFSTPTSAWSSYPWTRTALPSLLDMAYPIEAGRVGGATRADLYSIISGDNATVSILDKNGYTTVMVESGWRGSSCGEEIDMCLESPFLNETVFAVIEQTVLLRPVLRAKGHAFTVASLANMDRVIDLIRAFRDDGEPQFVFVHLMIPHPPFFLDAECETRYEHRYSEFTFMGSAAMRSTRVAGYLGQAACAERFMRQVSVETNDDDFVIFAGDHGTDSGGQSEKDPAEWTDSEVAERMNVLLSIRADGCLVDSPVVLPNVMRRLFTCLAADPIPDVMERMFMHRISGLISELDPDVVQGLLRSDD